RDGMAEPAKGRGQRIVAHAATAIHPPRAGGQNADVQALMLPVPIEVIGKGQRSRNENATRLERVAFKGFGELRYTLLNPDSKSRLSDLKSQISNFKSQIRDFKPDIQI
ncbi:MAG TPA: hypothetical protein VN541_01540, partial [Tepidisphaeraceae bacterium]|nr:hypothetical protein [Tepidisphaeraceae bacterium]